MNNCLHYVGGSCLVSNGHGTVLCLWIRFGRQHTKP